MQLALNNIDLALLMDVLALSASVVLIGFLIANRRRYGHLVAASRKRTDDFPSEMTLQLVNQQSRRSYAEIQQTLNREFANLQRMVGGEHVAWAFNPTDDDAHARPRQTAADRTHPRHYNEAGRMIRNGADPQTITTRCGLSRGEIDLITYMQHKNA